LQETFQAIWSTANRYVSLLFRLVKNERHLAIDHPHKQTFVGQLYSLLDGRVKQFLCQLEMTMSAAGFPRHSFRHNRGQPGCDMHHVPRSIFDKTQMASVVLRAFLDDFLDFCLTHFV